MIATEMIACRATDMLDKVDRNRVLVINTTGHKYFANLWVWI